MTYFVYLSDSLRRSEIKLTIAIVLRRRYQMNQECVMNPCVCV